MTDPREPDSQPELTTSRVRGGPSPWLVAAIALAVLGGVVYIGVSDQSKSTSSTTSPIARVSPGATSTLAPAPGLRTANAPAQPGPGFQAIAGPADAPRSRVATIMTIAGQAVFAATDQVGVGQLQSSYAVPMPVAATNATIDVVQVDELSSRADNYGSYSVDLGSFHGDVGQDSIVGAFAPTVLLDVDRHPDLLPSPDAPDIARNGYHLQVTGQQLDDKEVVAITLNVDRGIIFAIEDYQVAAHLKTRTITAPLDSVDLSRISGQIVLPASMHAGSVQIEVTGIPEIAPSLGRTSVTTLTVVLPPPDRYPTGTTAVDVAVDPNPEGLTGLQRSGFRATVTFALAGNHRVLELIISIPTPT